MSNAELIAEAEADASYQEIEAAAWAKRNPGEITHRAGRHTHTADVLRRLAAALRELDVPAGWRVTEYICFAEPKGRVSFISKDFWLAYDAKGHDLANASGRVGFPTAADAMAALEENE